jgi:hypothetical protein
LRGFSIKNVSSRFYRGGFVTSTVYTKKFAFIGSEIYLKGFSPTQDGVLDVNMKIEEFTEQVKKFGVIINQKVNPGATYSSFLFYNMRWLS